MQLRAAEAADLEALAGVWHEAWHDAHASLVPPELLPHRTREYFRGLAQRQLEQIVVAVHAEGIAGFVGVDEDELELLFVGRKARGTGLARTLIGWGEQKISRRFARAYLVVVEGNARAQRFYERCGWTHVGVEAYVAPIPGGEIPLACRRYEKSV
ncbi:MAG TPA: GNAT family N-acetyltransferase [Polyangiales bacterium]|nr:GNAT family N-acetyltransferase [Polyangiales bacterium]